MNKTTFNELMQSKEAQSFGTLGPQNSMTRTRMMGKTATSFLHASDSSAMGLDTAGQAAQQNVGS